MIHWLVNCSRDWLKAQDLWKYFQVLDSHQFRTLGAVLLTFALVIFMGRPTIRWLLKQKIGDQPEFYNADLNRLTRQKAATPTMGGVLIAGSILLATVLLADLTNFYVQMGLVCLVWLAILGAVDDWLKLTTARRTPGSREGLKSWEKMVFQVGIALLLGYFMYQYGRQNPQTHVLSLPFQRTIDPRTQLLADGLIYLGTFTFCILTILVIVGASNAVNLTDGMDGLASGIMGLVSFAFVIMVLITGNPAWAKWMLMPSIPETSEMAVIAGAMTGSCLGFLWWNCHPAQVFMGDTGSLPLGGLIGYIAVAIRQELLLFIIGGVFVAEALSVILQVGYFKFTKGQRLFRCAPIHHHFHLGGWTEQQVVVRFWLITAMLAVVALASLKLR